MRSHYAPQSWFPWQQGHASSPHCQTHKCQQSELLPGVGKLLRCVMHCVEPAVSHSHMPGNSMKNFVNKVTWYLNLIQCGDIEQVISWMGFRKTTMFAIQTFINVNHYTHLVLTLTIIKKCNSVWADASSVYILQTAVAPFTNMD